MKQKEMLKQKRKQQLEELGWDDDGGDTKGSDNKKPLNFDKTNKKNKKK